MSFAERLQLAGIALGCLLSGLALVFYERRRIQEGRPILAGRDGLQAYWAIYFTLFFVSLTLAAAAVVK